MAVVLHEVTVPERLDRLDELFGIMATAATAVALPDSKRGALALVIEEAFVNVCRHAYDGRADGEVGVRLAGGPGELTVEFRDTGPPFDPLRVPSPNLHASLEERRPGGLGIALMRRLTDEMRYRRDGAHNVLSLVFRW